MTEQERRALILCVERVHAVAGQLGRPGAEVRSGP